MQQLICCCKTLDICVSMSNVCCLGHIAHTCTAVLYGSTPHLVLTKLKASYNGVLRRLLLIVKPYSASEMFVTNNILSIYKLQRKCIGERISHSANNNKYKGMFISHRIYLLSNPTIVDISIVFILTFFFFSFVIIISLNMYFKHLYIVHGRLSEIKTLLS